MKFTWTMIIYLLITTLMLVTIILDHADNKNTVYIEIEATEEILRAAPYGYITAAIQQEIKDHLSQARGLDSSKITIEGTMSFANRKIKGSGNEEIELKISYPRTVLVFFGGVINTPISAYRNINTEYKP